MLGWLFAAAASMPEPQMIDWRSQRWVWAKFLYTNYALYPTKEELLSPLVSMPEKYLPLLQSD
jgi:hypothetical protein